MKAKNGSTPLESNVPAERLMENRLRDLLLDIEDRIYQGTLGSVKVCWPVLSLLGFNVISCSDFERGKKHLSALACPEMCAYTSLHTVLNVFI